MMCGISAIIALHGFNATANGAENDAETLSTKLNESLEMIKHRGPDSRGQWISKDNRVGIRSLDSNGTGGV